MPELPIYPELAADLNANFFVSTFNIGGETYLYLTIPYPSCTKPEPCDFCAFHGTGIPGLKPDRMFGKTVAKKVRHYLAIRKPQTLVLFNNGNILNPAEMDQTAILEDVPQAVAEDDVCQALELEIGIKDLLKQLTWDKIGRIRVNLSGKQLRLRLSVEYADDDLLKRHNKGITLEEIEEVIGRVNEEGVPWIGYALLGGKGMTGEAAQETAAKTGEFIIDRRARMIGVNGIYLTEGMRKRPGADEMYLPTIDDLIKTMKALTDYAVSTGVRPLTKVGLAEEDGGIKIVEYPYSIPTNDDRARLRMTDILRDFNESQNYDDFFSGVIQNWARFESFRSINSMKK